MNFLLKKWMKIREKFIEIPKISGNSNLIIWNFFPNFSIIFRILKNKSDLSFKFRQLQLTGDLSSLQASVAFTASSGWATIICTSWLETMPPCYASTCGTFTVNTGGPSTTLSSSTVKTTATLSSSLVTTATPATPWPPITRTWNSARAITIRSVDLLASFAYQQLVTQSICAGSEQHQLRRQLPGRMVVLALSARQHQRQIFAGPHVVRLSGEWMDRSGQSRDEDPRQTQFQRIQQQQQRVRLIRRFRQKIPYPRGLVDFKQNDVIKLLSPSNFPLK